MTGNSFVDIMVYVLGGMAIGSILVIGFREISVAIEDYKRSI